jgi:hypothetical protein
MFNRTQWKMIVAIGLLHNYQILFKEQIKFNKFREGSRLFGQLFLHHLLPQLRYSFDPNKFLFLAQGIFGR